MSFCDLSGKTILITGASSGIGRQTAIQVAEHGGKVVISGRNPSRLKETFESLRGDGHKMISADLLVTDEMELLAESLPALNGIAHCAGIVGPTPAKYIRRENIEKLLKINFEVPVLLTGKVLTMKKLADDASLIFMSSIATSFPYFGGALYSSAKAALEAYSRSLALELVGRGIRSNCLAPGLVNTPILTDPAKEGNPEIVDESIRKYLQKYPQGIGEPVEVAYAIVFLLSNESRWISGINIPMGAVLQ
jgi:NAD(P)-dependent dehydrogenase (short-subunit alcohol dehydrogenase family)